MRDAEGTNPAPAFLWDPTSLRLVWANDDGLAFWDEPSLEDLTERYFAPDSEIVRAFATLESGETIDRLLFTHSSRPIWAAARATAEAGEDGRELLRVELSSVEEPGDPATMRMRAAFEAAPRPMAIFGADGRALARNVADRFAFPGASDEFAVRFDDDDEAAPALAAVLADGGFSRSFRLSGRGGVARWRVTLRRFADPGVGGLAVLAEFVDLSLRRAAPARAPIEAAPEPSVVAATGFAEAPAPPLTPDAPPAEPHTPGASPAALAQIAHDLRAPLTAIQGFTDFMTHKGDEMSVEGRAAYLADIREASRRMLGLVDQIVALGAPEAAADAPEIESFDLNVAARDAARMAGPRARLAGVTMDLRLAAEEVRVIGSRSVVSRILDNLIDNALTHGQAGVDVDGAILVAVLNPSGGAPEIVVGDAGPGMTEDELSAALKPFASEQPAGRAGGLGLSNSARLARSVAARLAVETAPGEGLTARLIFAPA